MSLACFVVILYLTGYTAALFLWTWQTSMQRRMMQVNDTKIPRETRDEDKKFSKIIWAHLTATFTGYSAAVASSLLVPLILAQIEPTVLGVIRRALFSLSAQFKYAVQIGNCSGTFPSHSHLLPFTPVQQLEYLTAGILTAFVSLFSVYLWCFAAKSLFIAVR